MLWIFEILLNFQEVIESQTRKEDEGDQSSAEEETEVWKDIPINKVVTMFSLKGLMIQKKSEL